MHARNILIAALGGASALGFGGCQSLNNKERGAIIGAAGGAAVGGLIGRSNGSTSRGAIIGAVVGGAAGAIIGHQMDQQAKEIDQNVAGATVERVGEGIHVTFESGLLFDFDSSTLRPEARTNLSELARSFDKYPDTELVIVGHTDSDGDDAYNQRLSERRAAAAREFLVAQGVAPTRVRPAGRGEGEPVESNETTAGRQANRRVEVAIYASEALRERARREASE
jgi:outer membrane protein OmpA-like peptidoglycan-associated protein